MLIGSRMLKKVEWGLVSTRTWCSGRVRQVGRTNRAPDALTHAVQILQAFWHPFQDSKFTQNLNAIFTQPLGAKGNCTHFPWCAKIQEDLYERGYVTVVVGLQGKDCGILFIQNYFVAHKILCKAQGA